MFDQQQSSGLFQTVSRLGDAIGIVAAIYLTPLAFGWGKAAIGRYLVAQFGRDVAPYLLWLTFGLVAYVIYAVCKMLWTFAASWVMTALAARGLSNY